ncbi:hypothetical protein BDV93DRAFT_559831 [Ceratobasidium sp. AG-I]|nr:hypothetical protein BDV93DRAFT_559831 [Ceratobasidium sp. AG-I]
MPATKRPASQSVDISLDAFRASRPRTNPRDSLPCQPPQLPLETPSKQGSGSASQSQSMLASDQGNLLSKSKTSISATSTDTVRQDTIEDLLRSELNGVVWYDPNFFQKALPCSDDIFSAIRDTCEGLNSARTAWSSLPPTDPEDNCYTPILDLMNAIGRAAHAVVPELGVYVEFQDSSKLRLVSNDPTYPGIIRCEIPNALARLQWQDLDTFVEVKKDRGDMKEAIEQSSRYARALLGHRFDRRFLKTLAVCGTVARFLLFDRSGLVYSDELDIYTDALKFIRSFAGLLLLKGVDAGYNPMFNNLWGQSASGKGTLVRLVTTNNGLYKVLAVLCNRMAIRSRVTLVLALQELPISRLETNVSYCEDPLASEALKMAWWDPTRFPEGVILQQFRGMYGVSQIIDHGDVTFDGHRDIVYSRKGLVPGPLEEGLFNKQKENVDIKRAQQDDSRVYGWTLAVRGRPLTEASDPSELDIGRL